MTWKRAVSSSTSDVSRGVEAGRPAPRLPRLELPWRLIGASLLVTTLVAFAAFTFTVRSTHGFLVWSDGLAYFLYARSAVVDLDVDLSNEYRELDAKHPADSKFMEALRKWTIRGKDGSLHSPWPAGGGLVMVPFYYAGYGVEVAAAALSDRPPDSYGLIPQFAFSLGSVAFGALGFWCLVVVCREIAPSRIAYLSSAAIVLCGPVVFYVIFHPSMAHASSFGLVALATAIWLRAWKYGTTATAIAALGFVLGVAATVRYQNALFGILPIALVVRDLARSDMAVVFRQALIGLSACAIPVLAVVVPQIMKVSHGTGVNAAQYPIDLHSPYFFEVLFSCRHGAFHWAPVLAVAMFGLIWMLRRGYGAAGVLLLALIANVYLIGGLGLSQVAYGTQPIAIGWLHHWDDAPSFGMRYLTECAPLFAFGLAGLMQAAHRHVHVVIWFAVFALAAVWNGLLIVAYGLQTITRSGCLPYSDMVKGIGQAVGMLVRHQL